MIIRGNLVDIHSRTIFPAEITIKGRLVESIRKTDSILKEYIMPGLIDSHIHIESSLLTPGAFAEAAVKHGTIGVVADPHEIANVLGIEGVKYMVEDGKKSPLKFYFGAPSCVPATAFEQSGASLGPQEIKTLLADKDIKYLSEMMNYPGVINEEREVMEKLEIARAFKKPVDGHAPGLRGKDLEKYIKAGITTDHECSSIEEALEKISYGMKILIREGSAARNLNALKELYKKNAESIMLCSDDLHPEMLEIRHINKLVSSLVNDGYDIFDVVRSATENPKKHYGLDNGTLKQGQNADFIVVDSPVKMNVLETWINGEKVFDRGRVLFKHEAGSIKNNFNCKKIDPDDLKVVTRGKKLRVIEAFDGELITREIIINSERGIICDIDIARDILKLVVKDRYKDHPPAIAYIKGFGLKSGAFASSVAHDSHNIIAVGTNDRDITTAINEIIRMKGGLSVSDGNKIFSLPLNVAGIMSNSSCSTVAAQYLRLSDEIKKRGTPMSAPFMTLSFMALLVIPDLKLSDRGLFDGRKFHLVPLFED
jgi:adenine deaminase